MTDKLTTAPAELLYRIAKLVHADDPNDLNNLLYVNKTFSHIVIPIKYRTLHFDSYLLLHKAAPMLDSADTDRRDLYKSAPRKVVIGYEGSYVAHGDGWDYDRTISIISRFTSIETLLLSYLDDFPYYKLTEWLLKMPTLTRLEVMCNPHRGFLPKYYIPDIPTTFPNLTRLFVSDLEWSTMDGFTDQSTSVMAHISSLSTLRSITMDVHSWVCLSKGRWSDTLAVSSMLEEIVIYPGKDISVAEMRSHQWVRGLFRALRRCAASLHILRIELPQKIEGFNCEIVNLPQLSVLVGPEGITDKLALDGPLTVYWVTSGGKCLEVPRWEQLWPTIGNPDSMRMLRVGVWNTRALRLFDVLSCVPQLEELSLCSSTALTKQGLLDFGEAFKLCQCLREVTILVPPEPSISDDHDIIQIAASWREMVPNMETICLDTQVTWNYRYDWKGDAYGWKPRHLPWWPTTHANLPSGLSDLVPPGHDAGPYGNID
ncbi:hypothetical protein V5O48_007103 [Marasmius crinis-equi]|uniref:F-box domain-containing protein n=1 Tax=Marasmius crinis-equi TaxID=585013 RepID=A0ABR3FHW3_9AGAR